MKNGTSYSQIERYNLVNTNIHSEAGSNWHNDNRSWDNIIYGDKMTTWS